MRWPLYAVMALLVVAGCQRNPLAEPDAVKEDKKAPGGGGTGRNAVTAKGTPLPSPDFSSPAPTARPTPQQGGATPGSKETPVPTPTPPNGQTFQPGEAPAEIVIKFDETPGSWSIRPYLNRGRAGHVSGAIQDRLIVAEGDHRPGFEFLAVGSSSWVLDDRYDQELGAETERLKLHQGVSLAVGGVLAGEELWSAGGLAGGLAPDGSTGLNAFYLYRDVGFSSSRKVSEGGFSMNTGRYAAAGGVIGTEFIVCGGVAEIGKVVTSVERIDLTKLVGGKRTGKAMPVPVAGAASAVEGDKLYVIGGYTIQGGKPTPVTHVQVYDPKTDTWSKDGEGGAPKALPAAVHSAAASALEGVIYLAGGYGADGKPQSAFRLCTLTSGVWESGRDMPTPRALLSLTAHDGKIWAIGGVGTDRVALQTVEAYQP